MPFTIFGISLMGNYLQGKVLYMLQNNLGWYVCKTKKPKLNINDNYSGIPWWKSSKMSKIFVGMFDEDLPHIILTKTLTIRRKILFEILIYINSLGSDLPKIIIFWDILQVFKNLQRSWRSFTSVVTGLSKLAKTTVYFITLVGYSAGLFF